MRFTNQKRNHPFKNIVISVIIFLSVAGISVSLCMSHTRKGKSAAFRSGDIT